MEIKEDIKALKKHYLAPIVIILISALVVYFLYILYQTPAERNDNVIVMDNDLIAYEVTKGEGPEVKTGNTVSVNYIGAFPDGTKFDSSYDRGKPFSFTVGNGQVIRGWEQGILGMQVGGVRRLAIPPALGYGIQGVPGAIPPNATLIFEIELLEIN